MFNQSHGVCRATVSEGAARLFSSSSTLILTHFLLSGSLSAFVLLIMSHNVFAVCGGGRFSSSLLQESNNSEWNLTYCKWSQITVWLNVKVLRALRPDSGPRCELRKKSCVVWRPRCPAALTGSEEVTRTQRKCILKLWDMNSVKPFSRVCNLITHHHTTSWNSDVCDHTGKFPLIDQ